MALHDGAASIHWLRHAHASIAIDTGAPITPSPGYTGSRRPEDHQQPCRMRSNENRGRYLKTNFQEEEVHEPGEL
jgi:hypothetical protein